MIPTRHYPALKGLAYLSRINLKNLEDFIRLNPKDLIRDKENAPKPSEAHQNPPEPS
jgi:hypothetical protein